MAQNKNNRSKSDVRPLDHPATLERAAIVSLWAKSRALYHGPVGFVSELMPEWRCLKQVAANDQQAEVFFFSCLKHPSAYVIAYGLLGLSELESPKRSQLPQSLFLRADCIAYRSGCTSIPTTLGVLARTVVDVAERRARSLDLGLIKHLGTETEEERRLAKVRGEERARRERARLDAIQVHNEACRAFARIGRDEGLICPHCGSRSREDIEFVDYTGQDRKSFFVCRALGRSFGHEL